MGLLKLNLQLHLGHSSGRIPIDRYLSRVDQLWEDLIFVEYDKHRSYEDHNLVEPIDVCEVLSYVEYDTFHAPNIPVNHEFYQANYHLYLHLHGQNEYKLYDLSIYLEVLVTQH